MGSAIARIVQTVLSDRRSVLTVSAPATEVVGVADVAISLPRLIGCDGVLDTFELPLSEDERDALADSAAAVRKGIAEVDASACA